MVEQTKLEQQVMHVLDWAYALVQTGKGTFQSAYALADRYRGANDFTQISQIEKLLVHQLREATAVGFMSGLGGIVTLPIMLPANITTIILLQVRLAASVAALLGYDLQEARTKALVLVTLAGASAHDIAHDSGLKIGLKIGEQAVESFSEEVIVKITEKVGMRLAVVIGELGIESIETFLPIVGGVVDAAIDRHIFHETEIAIWEIFLTGQVFASVSE